MAVAIAVRQSLVDWHANTSAQQTKALARQWNLTMAGFGAAYCAHHTAT